MKRLAILCCFGLPTALFAADAAPSSPPSEMGQLQYFDGEWECEGQESETAGAKAHKTKTRVKVKDDLGGFWYSGKVEQDKTGDNPQPLEAKFHWTYDRERKRFEGGLIDNSGGYLMQSSGGWQGETITWTGQGAVQGQKGMLRDVITKKGEDEFQHTYEAWVDGKWAPVGEETCRRDKKKKKK